MARIRSFHYDVLRIKPAAQNKITAAREPAWINSTDCDALLHSPLSLSLSLCPPPPNNCTTSFLSQQYCSFHADWYELLLSEGERRENCMTSKHKKMKKNILSKISCSRGQNAIKCLPPPFTINTSNCKNTATMLCQIKC